ncbi:MAG: peptidoglycan-binding protein, partial [Bacteroidales bacterium]|nr:peptidoglycan-binding protein [Bacteroidales bacterium]
MKRILSTLTLLTVCLLLLPSGLQAQNKKKLNLTMPSVKLATVKFNADDPYAKENQNTDGTPWEKVSAEPVKLPEGVKAVIPAPLPDVSKISMIEYNMAVSVAFESLRIIYGEMSEKDAEKFMQMWAPLFDNPTQEIIDYMNKLTPLLSQFIVARESYLNSVSNVELLTFDAAEALGWDDKEAFSSAMFQAKLYTGTLKQLEAAMDELANHIQALGNPPNPFEARMAARDRYRRAFKPKEIYLGETWMGTRIDKEHQVEGLDPLTEPMMRYLMKVKVNGEDRYFVLELKEEGIPIPDDPNDPYGVGNVKIEQMYFSDKGNLRPDFKSDGTFQTYYPKPPVMAITMMTMNLMRQFETSYVSDDDRKKDPNYAARKEKYHEMAGHYGSRVMRGGVFFKTALLWAMEDKFNTYAWKDDGVVPHALIEDLEEAFKKQAAYEAENSSKLPKLRLGGNKKKKVDDEDAAADAQAAQAVFDEASARKQQVKDSLAHEEQSKQESIAWREENIKLIEQNIARDEKSRSDAVRRYNAAKTAQERQWIQQEIDDYDRRIMYQRSDIQSERDNIRQLQTGQFVHTRTEFEQYANAKMIHDAKVEAERYIQTKKAAAIIDRQINLLPEEDRDAARDRAEKMFYEDGALASGDIEKARKLANIFNNQILGHELKVQAEAQDEVAWADLKEAGANAVIMACGSITVGLAGEALAGAYGAGTEEAVRDFQKMHGLSRMGVADAKTLKTLFDANAKKAMRPYMLRV